MDRSPSSIEFAVEVLMPISPVQDVESDALGQQVVRRAPRQIRRKNEECVNQAPEPIEAMEHHLDDLA
jgi:hypothetical protein